MSSRAHVSAKGQVVIPKDVRDRLAWAPGTASGVMLRRVKLAKAHDLDTALGELQSIVHYDGLPGTDDDWNATVVRMFEERAGEWRQPQAPTSYCGSLRGKMRSRRKRLCVL